ncbi:MAG: ABC transporter ATP-binding protein [Candidatus Liptonbacteria bacterium]|nr:ABC transporter ATP-binding protein [Candidatus Liptonbacteria bacterium]
MDFTNFKNSEVLLGLRDLHVHYGGVKALDGASVALAAGEVVALMGPNGAGKSTVLKAIFGLALVTSGEIYWGGKKIKPVSREMVERGIAFVPQGRRVFRHLTVLENLEVAALIMPDKKLRGERVAEVLDTLPLLKPKIKTQSGSLSGGEQQMLALARGLMVDPKVLLLDEPSLGLAPKVVVEIFALIREINARHGTAILVVEHNIKSVLQIVHRAYILDKGRVVAEGTPGDLPAGIMEKVFLGQLE